MLDVRRESNMDSSTFETRLDRYACECNPLATISKDGTELISCKSACVFLSWHLERTFDAPLSVRSFLKYLSKYCKRIQKRVLSRSLRIEIAYRQRYTCNKCRQFPIPPNFEVDHIIELQDGGEDVASNLQALCPGCHADKTRLNRLRKNHIFTQEYTPQYQAFVPPSLVPPVERVALAPLAQVPPVLTSPVAIPTALCPSGQVLPDRVSCVEVFSKYFSKNTL